MTSRPFNACLAITGTDTKVLVSRDFQFLVKLTNHVLFHQTRERLYQVRVNTPGRAHPQYSALINQQEQATVCADQVGGVLYNKVENFIEVE